MAAARAARAARHGRSGGTAGPARGDSGPRVGACPVPRPGCGPAGSRLRPVRHRGAAWAWTTPSWCSACASLPRAFCCRARSSAWRACCQALLAASRQTTDLAEPYDAVGMILQRARADIFYDRLLQQHAPSARRPWSAGIAQACRDRLQPGSVAGGPTEGQALLQHPDGLLQVPLGEV